MFSRQFPVIACLWLTLLMSEQSPSKKNVKVDQINQIQATPTVKTDNDDKRGKLNTTKLLKQKVLNKEQGAVNLAKEMGKSAVTILKPLAKNSDAGVRKLALNCLYYTGGGEGVAEIFIGALKDEANVSVEAVRGLQQYLSPAIYSQLLEMYAEVESGTRRKDIALMLGRMEGAKISDLKQKDEGETDAEAKEGLMVAMAKLDDQKSRDDFVDRLHKAKNQELKRYLDYVDYIGKTWAIKALSPILNDKSPLVYIGVDGIDEGAENLRACDIAVNLISKIMKPKFSFTIKGDKNYTDSELQEVKAYLATLR